LVARLLGVDNRGELALLSLVPLVLSQLGGLGLPLALTYYVAARPESARQLLADLRPVVIWQVASLLALHACLLWALFAGSSGAEIPYAAAVTLLVVPGTLAQQYGLALLQGLQQYRAFNILRLTQTVLYSLGAVVAYVAGWRDLLVVTVIWVLSTVGAGVLTIVVATASARERTRDSQVDRRQMLGFGLRGLLGYVSPVENFRLDQAVAGFLLSPSALGIYVVGAAFTNLPRFVAQSVGMVAYPAVASQPTRRLARREMMRFFVVGSLMSAGVVAILEALAAWMVPFFYGQEFEPAVQITQILLLGSLFLSLRRLLTDGLRGMGLLGIGSVAELIGWVTLAPCFLVLVPLYGLEGIAWSVVIAWGVSLIAVAAPAIAISRVKEQADGA
jgi:O-antigen/teichoic acid export membrane protein